MSPGPLAIPSVIAALIVAAVISPAVTAREQRPAVVRASTGEFVWHDLVTPNPSTARTFYGALFGWTFEEGSGVDPGYTIIRQGGVPVGGIVRPRQENVVAQWLSYVTVENVDRATKAFRASGGTVYRGPLDARKDLRVAVVADAQGAALGLANRGPRIEEQGPPAVNRWLWIEYVARDPSPALTFFDEVLGFKNEISDKREGFTYYLLSTDRPRAGLFRTPWERETSAWLPYVRVEDPAASAARAVQLGGQILLSPRAEVRNASLAIVLDPDGAAVALQRFPFK